VVARWVAPSALEVPAVVEIAAGPEAGLAVVVGPEAGLAVAVAPEVGEADCAGRRPKPPALKQRPQRVPESRLCREHENTHVVLTSARIIRLV
jgi:hypothetical protein